MSAKSSHQVAKAGEVKDFTDTNGRLTISFPPEALNIVWGGDERYWNTKDKSAAELVQVCWLEVTGSTRDIPQAQKVEGGKTYEVSFKVSKKDGAFGWTNCPVRVMAKCGRRGKQIWKKVDIEKLKTNDEVPVPEETLEIAVDRDLPDKTIYFGLYEVWSGRWKGGLVIKEAVIREV